MRLVMAGTDNRPGRPPELIRRLVITANPTKVHRSRDLARQACRSWNLAHMADDAELIMSEIVTNAVRKANEMSPASLVSFGIELDLDDRTLFLWAWDSNPKMPELQKPDIFSEEGRGLFIVQQLVGADDEGKPRMGVQPAPGGGPGKTVWARLPVDGKGLGTERKRKDDRSRIT
jgi:hypothetical protein